jgi:hypothetical protein
MGFLSWDFMNLPLGTADPFSVIVAYFAYALGGRNEMVERKEARTNAVKKRGGPFMAQSLAINSIDR